MNNGLKRIAAALAALLAACAAQAQQWTSLGPDGGNGYYLLTDPGIPGRIYAAGQTLFASSDAGQTWSPAANGLDVLARGSILGLGAELDFPSLLYLIDADGRVMRSSDGAGYWTPSGFRFLLPPAPFGRGRIPIADVPGSTGSWLVAPGDGYVYRTSNGGVGFQPLAYLPERSIDALAVDPGNTQNVLLGRGYDASSQPGPALLRSTDGGVTWQAPAGQPQIGAGSSIQFVPDGRVLAVLNNRVHVSYDAGASWTPTEAAATGLALAFLPPYEAVAVTSSSCARSANFLAGWQDCSSGLPAASAQVRFGDVAIVADSFSTFRAIASGAGAGLRALASGGGSWTASNRGFASRLLRGLALPPGRPDAMFAGRWDTDSWVPTPLLASADGGGNWQPALAGRANYVRSLALDPTSVAAPGGLLIFAGGLARRPDDQAGDSGLWRSSDGGANWLSLGGGLPLAGAAFPAPYVSIVRALALDPRSCAAPPPAGPCTQGPLNRVFALTGRDGWRVIRSQDRGDNWVSGESGLPQPDPGAAVRESVFTQALAFDASNGDVLLGAASLSSDSSGNTVPGTVASGVFRSTDGGLSWQHRSQGLPLMTGSTQTTQDVYALAAHPRRSGTYWASLVQAGQAARIYKTLDGGASWNASGAPLDGCDVRDLQVDTADSEIIVAAGIGTGFGSGCLWRSENGGASWTSLATGAPMGRINDVRWQRGQQGRLIVTTEAGAWALRSAPDRIFAGHFQD